MFALVRAQFGVRTSVTFTLVSVTLPVLVMTIVKVAVEPTVTPKPAVVQADGDAGRLLACTLYAVGGEKDWQVYMHAKVGIVDDAWMTIGSANLNEHSLFNDTEMNVVTHDAALAQQTRLRLWAEHLQRPVHEVATDPIAVIDGVWKPLAREQAARRTRGERATQRLTLLPGVSRRSRLLLGPLQGLVVDA